jgi:transposase InsO family protein
MTYNWIPISPQSQTDHWRDLADYWRLTAKAKQRLEWLIFYYSVGKRDATVTAGYFGISRKTLHKWKNRFNPQLIQSLEEKSRAPIRRRTWEVTQRQEQRVIGLREQTKKKWGKAKLRVLYRQKYHQDISTWKIERVVRKHGLYPDPADRKKRAERRKSASKKIRIQQARRAGIPGPMWHVDSVIIWWYGVRKVIFTALEDTSRLAYARVYTSGTSTRATDFLHRLTYLCRDNIRVIHSDNGGEFAKNFAAACEQMNISQIYSRIQTPRDNPALERFNRTLQEEWLAYSEVGLDEIDQANHDLTEWLVEYNSVRPHQALDYQTPLAYAAIHSPKVLPMSPARALICIGGL